MLNNGWGTYKLNVIKKTMSIESDIKTEFEKLFQQQDWELFKIGANYYLRSAAYLKNKDIKLTDIEQNMTYCKDNRLLFRNIQKRLWIGIAGELLIKAHFLKSGYLINKSTDRDLNRIAFHKIGSIDPDNLKLDDTFTFDQLISALPRLEKDRLNDNKHTVPPEITEGLRIAKVFRNKEAHIITDTHDYNEKDYGILEKCMKRIYKDWFKETLEFQISFSKNETEKFETN